MTTPSPRATDANTCELRNSRGERFLIGLTIPSGGEPPMRFWDERTAREWLLRFAEEDSGALRHLATMVGVWVDLPGLGSDRLLGLLATNLARGQLTVVPSQAVQTRAMQARVQEPEEASPIAPNKPQESWIRIDCEAVMEKPIGETCRCGRRRFHRTKCCRVRPQHTSRRDKRRLTKTSMTTRKSPSMHVSTAMPLP